MGPEFGVSLKSMIALFALVITATAADLKSELTLPVSDGILAGLVGGMSIAGSKGQLSSSRMVLSQPSGKELSAGSTCFRNSRNSLAIEANIPPRRASLRAFRECSSKYCKSWRAG